MGKIEDGRKETKEQVCAGSLLLNVACGANTKLVLTFYFMEDFIRSDALNVSVMCFSYSWEISGQT